MGVHCCFNFFVFENFHKMLIRDAWEAVIATRSRKTKLKILSGVITVSVCIC